MDYDASKIPLLEASRQRGRRPNTLVRTGRRGRLNALAVDSRTLVGSSSNFSTRHTRALQETGGDPVVILNRLLNTLQESRIPGPQLFRLQSEFSEPLGQGGQGNVRGLNPDAAKRYQGTDKTIQKNWAAEDIAIKQHVERRDSYIHNKQSDLDCPDKNNLSWRFRAAECEVLALAPGLFQNHPNIVKLLGWGLCLDTAENPASQCCGGLQLPLLVFERAEMNLAQFLENLFATTRDERGSEECLLEEGFGRSSQMRRPLSLPGSAWCSFQSWIRPKENIFDLIRLLCIDIGQGLKSLHENNFTHGDLKPENILIFKEGSGWRAKLCDFGCAMGYDSSASVTPDDVIKQSANPKRQSKLRGATYLGTDGWKPPDCEIQAIRGFDELRRCDLYVYGLLVWSSFCQQGEPHRGNPKLQDMLEDVEEITISTKYHSTSHVCKLRIASEIAQVLEDTMKTPEQRSLEPWALFSRISHRTGWARKLLKIIQDSRKAAKPEVQTYGKKLELSPKMKQYYNKMAWWSGDDQAAGQTDPHSNDGDDSNGDNKPGPASAVALDSDDNCLSTKLFYTKRRKSDAKEFHARLSEEVELAGLRDQKNLNHRLSLYYFARFRSRLPMAWWRIQAKDTDNILQKVLQIVPPVDIHTLAWFCAGPVGRVEVSRLSTYEYIWASMTRSDRLNESERLDRFLLLLQFGAPVATPTYRISRRFRADFMHQGDLTTIFVQFLESCRPAIVPTVLNLIFQRLRRAQDEGSIPDATLKYFDRMRVGDGNCPCLLDRFLELVDPSLVGAASEEAMRSVESEEPLIDWEMSTANRPRNLPHGWTSIGGEKDLHKCYKDEFTHSVTLKKPRISPLQLRHLTVGFLQEPENNGISYHVDLLACTRAVSDPKDGSELAQHIEQRFPYYDEAWYMAEWNTDPVVVDVLKTLKDEISTFTSRLRAPEINKAIKFGVAFIEQILDFAFQLGARRIHISKTVEFVLFVVIFSGISIIVGSLLPDYTLLSYNLVIILCMISLVVVGLGIRPRT